MMLIFTDAQNNQSIAVNPEYIVIVFTAKNEEGVESVVVNTTTGNIVVAESYLDVVGRLNAGQ